MNITIERGRLSLDLYDLLGELTDEQRKDVIDMLACRDEVINEVANQIIDGWTTAGSHGPTGWGGNPDAIWGIDGARMRIAKASSDIAAREIKQLAEEIERAKASERKGWDAYHELLGRRHGSAS